MLGLQQLFPDTREFFTLAAGQFIFASAERLAHVVYPLLRQGAERADQILCTLMIPYYASNSPNSAEGWGQVSDC